jgi:AraC-like DNA-binding protein
MKIQIEEIAPNENSSFNIMVNPRLSDFYFWHFHEAFELVYIEGCDGTRQVGEHISKYEGSDLVFIGSNIPHLNFDFGVKTDYEKRVLHIQADFLLNSLLKTPELKAINFLFEKAKYGISFGEKTKIALSEKLKNLYLLPIFEQFLEVLSIFQYLAEAIDYELLHSKPIENQYNSRETLRMKKLYQFLDENYLRKIEVNEVADLCNLSKAAFCRFFKQMTKLTFIEFLNNYRINHAKNLLLSGNNVSETCFESGFESLSYFNRTFKKITGENPLVFKRKFGV